MTLSVMIMSLTLLVLAVFLLATDNMMTMLDRTREELKVYVYFKDDVSYSRIEQEHRRLLGMQQVESIVYVSEAEAMLEFREQLGDESYILETLDANPLPASFRVSLKKEAKDKRSMETFAARVAQLDIVEEVNYGKDFLDRFTMLTQVFMYIDGVLGVIVLLSSIFIISNTVRLTVLGRQKSIEIQKLVGATNRFITTPFVIEGAVQGGLAALVSLGCLAVIFAVVKNMVPDVAFLTMGKMATYVMTCILLGSIGSYSSLRSSLRL